MYYILKISKKERGTFYHTSKQKYVFFSGQIRLGYVNSIKNDEQIT